MAVFSTADASIIVAVITLLGAVVMRDRQRNKQLDQINRAVNQVMPGEPTLIQRVRMLEQHAHHERAFRHWMRETTIHISQQVGLHIPTPPEEHHERELDEQHLASDSAEHSTHHLFDRRSGRSRPASRRSFD